eukprot:TRINITY_DN18042_c0_g1_i1.p1 TRINITY_DN18042_c0_g1~~TRINITY_DN18042_c0_g1_i1.p1  ORF type:complete len:121 (-),score=37.42 TRINITY_DN18042_c0_g1_i1:413-775(-)
MRMIMITSQKVGQKTSAKVEGKSNDAIVTETSSNKAWFAWLPSVTDETGASIKVLTSSVSNSNYNGSNVESGDFSNQVYFTFVKSRATFLHWDPQIGVQTSPSSIASFSAFFLIIVVFLF